MKDRLAWSVVVLAFAASELSARPASIQAGDFPRFSIRIRGTISDFEKLPVPAASIGIGSYDKTVWMPQAKSASDGRYAFTVKLQRGTYQLIAAVGPFEIASREFEVHDGREPRLSLDLTAAETSARSDTPPRATPQVGQLPAGSVIINIARGARRNLESIGTPGVAEQEFVNVFYATNRTPVEGRSGYYVDRVVSAPAVSYGVSTVHIPPIHERGQMERPSVWRLELGEDRGKHIVITRREELAGEAAFHERLRTALDESGREAFLFIHGYNVPFDDAVRRTAQLFYDLEFDGVPILFSWPAQTAWWRYPAAEDVVDLSARDLERFLSSMLANQRLTAVNVIAHSMGNRVLASALERMALQNRNPGFKNLVMAAPDINVADFKEVSAILRRSAAQTTVYASSHDVALQCSKAFHSYARIGEAPPASVADGIDMIDASAIPHDILGHSYFGESKAMIRDMVLLIKQGLRPEARALKPMSIATGAYWVVPGE